MIDRSPSRLRLQTLIRLRWIAVAGQVVAVLGTYLGLGFDLPIGPTLAIIAVSAWINVLLSLRFPARHRLSVMVATALLGYDVVQLAALLYVTGGLQNPFAFLIIAPATVSAATLPLQSTLVVSGVTAVAAGLLAKFYWPLPWYAGESLDLPLLYKTGVWASIICGMAFMGLYARRLARESRQMSEALAATELVLAREQKLHALDGLAAAAAHELGTPLATITLVAKEIERDLPPGSPIADDVGLLRSQAQRCREILETLTHRSNEDDPLHIRLPLTHLIEEAVEPYRVFDKEIIVSAGPAANAVATVAAAEPVGERRPGVVHGLTNIVENAVDFATERVDISAEWSAETVTVRVSDDGPGFPPSLLDSLGEPFITTRGLASRRDGDVQDGAGGLGLGFFIAKTLLERSGASLSLANRAAPLTGAVVTVVWPRRGFEPSWQEADRPRTHGGAALLTELAVRS